jgi:hypothetical protein
MIPKSTSLLISATIVLPLSLTACLLFSEKRWEYRIVGSPSKANSILVAYDSPEVQKLVMAESGPKTLAEMPGFSVPVKSYCSVIQARFPLPFCPQHVHSYYLEEVAGPPLLRRGESLSLPTPAVLVCQRPKRNWQMLLRVEEDKRSFGNSYQLPLVIVKGFRFRVVGYFETTITGTIPGHKYRIPSLASRETIRL